LHNAIQSKKLAKKFQTSKSKSYEEMSINVAKIFAVRASAFVYNFGNIFSAHVRRETNDSDEIHRCFSKLTYDSQRGGESKDR